MDIQTHAELIRILESEFVGAQAQFIFTQWDTDGEDEEESTFAARLLKVSLSDNEFEEKDLLLTLENEAGEDLELLMELPSVEEDLGSFADGRLSLYGTEAELVLKK
ncbi:UNVERIFIED_CONTAM: hypothetical protein ABID98_002552 [Brevibacillus sp. OAP136]